MREAEEFREELLAQIDAGEVIPVVGSELLAVVAGDREAPLYQVLAERLLAKYGLIAGPEGPSATSDATVVAVRPYHELNDAVCEVGRPLPQSSSFRRIAAPHCFETALGSNTRSAT